MMFKLYYVELHKHSVTRTLIFEVLTLHNRTGSTVYRINPSTKLYHVVRVLTEVTRKKWLAFRMSG